MRSAERDALLGRQVQAAEAAATFSMRISDSLGVLTDRERERKRREQDASFPPPHRLLHRRIGQRVCLRAIPGFCEQWNQTVPIRHLLTAKDREGMSHTIVLCSCGGQTVIEGNPVDECAGKCGRFFFPTERAVYWHEYPEDDE